MPEGEPTPSSSGPSVPPSVPNKDPRGPLDPDGNPLFNDPNGFSDGSGQPRNVPGLIPNTSIPGGPPMYPPIPAGEPGAPDGPPLLPQDPGFDPDNPLGFPPPGAIGDDPPGQDEDPLPDPDNPLGLPPPGSIGPPFNPDPPIPARYSGPGETDPAGNPLPEGTPMDGLGRPISEWGWPLEEDPEAPGTLRNATDRAPVGTTYGDYRVSDETRLPKPANAYRFRPDLAGLDAPTPVPSAFPPRPTRAQLLAFTLGYRTGLSWRYPNDAYGTALEDGDPNPDPADKAVPVRYSGPGNRSPDGVLLPLGTPMDVAGRPIDRYGRPIGAGGQPEPLDGADPGGGTGETKWPMSQWFRYRLDLAGKVL